MEDLIRTPLTVVHVLACAFLILVVLLQPGKSGGLGLFATPAATQVFGGRGAGTILSKVTWVTTVVFFLSSISLAYLSTSSDESLQERAAAAEEAKLGNVEKKDEPGPAPAEKKPAPEKPAPEKPAPEQSASEQSVPERSEPEETAPGQPAPPAPAQPAPKQAAPKKAAPKKASPASEPAQPAPPAQPPQSAPAQPAPAQPGAPTNSE